MTQPATRRFAGGACAAAALLLTGQAGAGTSPPPPAGRQLDSVGDVFAALRACWVPPPLDLARKGMQITVRFSFTRDGRVFGVPRFTYFTPGAGQAARAAYAHAVGDTLDRCNPLPFSPALGRALAGQPFAIRFVDRRTP